MNSVALGNGLTSQSARSIGSRPMSKSSNMMFTNGDRSVSKEPNNPLTNTNDRDIMRKSANYRVGKTIIQ